MLRLRDFFHLPPVDALVAQLVADGPGLLVVAGLDPRPAAASGGSGVLAAGRATFFRVLMHEILAAQPSATCIAVTEARDAVRISRQLQDRVVVSLVQPPYTYEDRIAHAAERRPDLLVVDRLGEESVPAALAAAQGGLRVLSQLDTVFRGTEVLRHLLDLGAGREQLGSLAWIVAVHGLAALCPHCRQPVAPDTAQLARLARLHPDLEALIAAAPDGEKKAESGAGTFFEAAGCERCDQHGRRGHVTAFDIFRAWPGTSDPFEQPSVLPMEAYVLRLALRGDLALNDALQFEADQFHQTYNLLVASERALVEANATLERRLAQLEAANRVLEQRTKELISLQDLGQALITSTELDDLATRVCRRARDLCGADRAILYFFRALDEAEVLAVLGWDAALVHQAMAAEQVLRAASGKTPSTYNHWPPGVSPHLAGVERTPLQAGLAVPLIAQGERVGLMIVHTTQKARFAPGEVALLQTFANQAALAIQRAGLIAQLRAKIAQLEAAQAGLAQKERLERELELARQVQQSVLPRTFPQVAGYAFAALNEPARQVGGDFYDVIALDDEHFGLAVADVSGKGMAAALYMALTRSLLLAEARRERAPRVVLSNVNQLLLELGEPNMFVTVFYGVVERATRRLAYARAGHDRPLLLREGGILELGGRGVALGLLESDDLPLSEEALALAPGDRLVLYTDGLTDVMAPDGQLFDRARLKTLLQTHASLPPDALCAAVFADLVAYQGDAEQYDDKTMLVLAAE